MGNFSFPFLSRHAKRGHRKIFRIFLKPDTGADRYSAVCFDVRDNADASNSMKLKFEGSRALTKAINFQYFYIFGLYISQLFHRYIVIHGSAENDAGSKRLSVTLRLS